MHLPWLSLLRARALRSPAPIAVGFELTHRCNLHCSLCDRNKKLPNEMTLGAIKGALRGLCDLGMHSMSIDGGEPLVHPQFDDVVAWLHDRGIVLRLNTNGVLVGQHRAAIRRMTKIKISLDGSPAVHDSVRGSRSFERALVGARVAQDDGVAVELTCVVGTHNAEHAPELLEIASRLNLGVVFQPRRVSLLDHRGAFPQREIASVRQAFLRLEALKRAGAPVLNRWSSLRHFRNWPQDTWLPCAAGWINATLDPEGNLFACAQYDRTTTRHNVVALGVREAFARLVRVGCGQCWCARVVEENYAWGLRPDWNVSTSSRELPVPIALEPGSDSNSSTSGGTVPADQPLHRLVQPGLEYAFAGPDHRYY